MNGHSCYFRRYRVPAATQSTIPAFRLPCKSVFRDSHHNVSSLNSSNITNRQPEIPSSKKPKHYTIESLSNRFRLGETPKKLFVFSSSPRRLIQLYRPPNTPATRNRVKWDTNRTLKGSQTPFPGTKVPSQSVLRVAKNLQKTSKKPHKRRRNHSNPRRKPGESPLSSPYSYSPAPVPRLDTHTYRYRKPLPFHPERNRRRGAQLREC